MPSASSILDALDADQRSAAEVLAGPLLIVAGPGTGKTRTLTHRLAHLVATGAAAAEECLAVTFTRRAAEEMRERLEELLSDEARRLTVTTFHALGLSILRRERGALGLHRGFRVADARMCLDLAAELFGLPGSRAARLLEELSRYRRRHLEADGDSDELAAKLSRYRSALRDRDLVDFDDLLALPVELLAGQAELREAYRRRYRHLSIDEYQDIDALQYRLVRLLVSPGGNLCAIGDPDQSIYRFRGADVGFFLRFREDYPEARVVQLGRNYRSSRTIVEAAVQAIAPASLVGRRELSAVGDATAEPIAVHAAASEAAEAEQVAHAIERLLGGTSYFSLDSGRVAGDEAAGLSFDDFAVLYRTDAQSAAVIEALERAGIPHQKRSHDRLGERPGVRQVLAELADEGATRPAVRRPGHQATLPGLVLPVTARLAAAAERAIAADAEAEPAIASALDLLEPLAREHGDDLEGFLAAVALGAEVDAWDPRAERVSLLTLHAAKGLEFPVVFLVGCAAGLLPLHHAATAAEVDEERRLFFVGVTRARSRLFLSYPRRRRWRGRVVDVEPSPFLEDIDEGLLDRSRGVRRRKREAGPRQLSLL